MLMMQQVRDSEAKKIGSKSAEELKDRLKQLRSLELLSKEETIKLRRRHIG